MTKPATLWRPDKGSETISELADPTYLVTQAGDNITDQSGNKIVLNLNIINPKPPTTWSE